MSGIESNKDQFSALADNPSQDLVSANSEVKKRGGNPIPHIRIPAPLSKKSAGKINISQPRAVQGEEDWDLLMLVQYPSRKAFLEMTSNPGYLKVHEYRADGVERAVLYATDPVTFKAILAD